MKDKEVGDLLRGTEIFGSDFNKNGAPIRSHGLKIKMRDLIHKLIETRECWLRVSNVGYFSENALMVTLEQYGITEDEWNNKVSEKP